MRGGEEGRGVRRGERGWRAEGEGLEGKRKGNRCWEGRQGKESWREPQGERGLNKGGGIFMELEGEREEGKHGREGERGRGVGRE